MGQCFLYGNGGSGGLQVRTGLTAPGMPQENMLWVKSDRAGKKYVFAETAPEEPAEGLIWFRVTGNGIITRSDVYVDGAWTAADTYIRLSGAWVRIASARVYLTNKADPCAEVTGGWEPIRWYWDANASGNVPTVSWEADGVHIAAKKVPGPGGMIVTGNAVDLTNASAITIGCASASGEKVWCKVSTGTADKFHAGEVASAVLTAGTNTLDVSGLKGAYYIGLIAYYNFSVVVTETYVE